MAKWDKAPHAGKELWNHQEWSEVPQAQPPAGGQSPRTHPSQVSEPGTAPGPNSTWSCWGSGGSQVGGTKCCFTVHYFSQRENESLPNAALSGDWCQTALGSWGRAGREQRAARAAGRRAALWSHLLLSLAEGTWRLFSWQVTLKQPLPLLCVTIWCPQAKAKVLGLLYTGRTGGKPPTNKPTEHRKHELSCMYYYYWHLDYSGVPSFSLLHPWDTPEQGLGATIAFNMQLL